VEVRPRHCPLWPQLSLKVAQGWFVVWVLFDILGYSLFCTHGTGRYSINVPDLSRHSAIGKSTCHFVDEKHALVAVFTIVFKEQKPISCNVFWGSKVYFYKFIFHKSYFYWFVQAVLFVLRWRLGAVEIVSWIIIYYLCLVYAAV